MKILLIERLDRYRDGGTISVKCFRYLGQNNTSQELQICLDNRIGSDSKGKLWLGYPGKTDSAEITDEGTISHIIEKLKKHKERQQFYIDEVIGACSKNE